MVTEPATEQTSFGVALNLATRFDSWKPLAAIAVLLTALFAVTFVRVLKRHAAKRQNASENS